MTRTEHLLTILSEECNETAQRVSKALRFSLEEVQPGQQIGLDNAERILVEFFDAWAMIRMLTDEGKLPMWSDLSIESHVQSKKIRVETYLRLSKENGTLQ